MGEPVLKRFDTTKNEYVTLSMPMLHFGTIGVPKIKKVIFNDPATIVYWADGDKTVVKAQIYNKDIIDINGDHQLMYCEDEFNPEVGLAMAICKKAFGNKGNFNEVFKKWIPNY